MKYAKLIVVTTLMALVGGPSIANADELRSLRGSRTVDDLSMTPARAGVILPDEGLHERSYEGQPPMVPHKVKPERISLKNNQCLECHSDLNYKDLKATKIHDSHFVNRAGERLGSVSTRFYFCTQCHAQQIDKTPLVTNNFRP